MRTRGIHKPHELTLIYHSEKPGDEQTKNYVTGLPNYHVKAVDLKKETLTPGQITEIARKMDGELDELVDLTYEDRTLQPNFSLLSCMSKPDILMLLRHDPKLVNTPIVVIGKHAYHCSSPKDLPAPRSRAASRRRHGPTKKIF